MKEPMRSEGTRRRRCLERGLRIAAAVGIAAGVLHGPIAAADEPTSRIRGIDVYRTTQLDPRDLVRSYEPMIRDLAKAIDARDEEAVTRLYPQLMGSIVALGDFAYAQLGITTTFADGENLIDVSIELVDPADAAARLSFAPEPTGSIPDPGGLLDAWQEYQDTAFELARTRQIEPTVGECPAHHCIWEFTHPALAPFLSRFDRGAREHHDALVRVLRNDADPRKRANAAFVLAHLDDAEQLVLDLVPSLEDPVGGVRNNVMRVLAAIAERDDDIEIPFAPLAKRIDDPDSACRNKAAELIAALAHRPEYRDDLLAAAPGLMRLLRLQKPNNHEPAYEILKTISGADFGPRDYARWEAWIEEARGAQPR